jgi:16S rRNA (guanine527-N7)-methyltransferase
MSSNKEIFLNYLKENFNDRYEELKFQFEAYFLWLSEINKEINLISRKTDPDLYWTLHFLDSILITEFANFDNKKVLDFGTGGGLPGIPLAILYPTSNFYLLDSRKKKLLVLDELCDLLQLDNVDLIVGRVEEVDIYNANKFDAVVSRSVRIKPEFKKSLFKMTKAGSTLYFYKSIQLDDMEQFKRTKVHNVTRDEIGTRNIVEVSR